MSSPTGQRWLDRPHGAQRGAESLIDLFPCFDVEGSSESTPMQFYERETLLLNDSSRGMEIRRDAARQGPSANNLLDPTPANTEPTKPGDSTPEAAFARMAESFVQAVQTAFSADLTHYNERPKGPNIEFHGLDHEDPDYFIRKLEEFFGRARLTHDSDRFNCMVTQLRGDAKQWVSQYRTLITTYSQLKERFLNRFNSSDIQSQAIAKLYGTRQGPSDETAVFITRKACLFQRIDSFKPEAIKTRVIMDQLRPEIRSRLRAHPISNIEMLVAAATSIEKDLEEEQTSQVKLPASHNARAPYYQGPGHQGNQPNYSHRSSECTTPNRQNSSYKNNYISNPAQQTHRPDQAHAAPRVHFNEERPRYNNHNFQYRNSSNGGSARDTDRPNRSYNGGVTRDVNRPINSSNGGNDFRRNDRPRVNFNGDGAANFRVADRAPTPCRYCTDSVQWHYHSQCPNNPHRERRTGNVQGSRVPGPGTSARPQPSRQN